MCYFNATLGYTLYRYMNMGKSTISMVMFHSYVSHSQRVFRCSWLHSLLQPPYVSSPMAFLLVVARLVDTTNWLVVWNMFYFSMYWE